MINCYFCKQELLPADNKYYSFVCCKYCPVVNMGNFIYPSVILHNNNLLNLYFKEINYWLLVNLNEELAEIRDNNFKYITDIKIKDVLDLSPEILQNKIRTYVNFM